MIDVAALAALRPALGEFGIEEEKAAEGEEVAREMALMCSIASARTTGSLGHPRSTRRRRT
jgi:hypothetical protein